MHSDPLPIWPIDMLHRRLSATDGVSGRGRTSHWLLSALLLANSAWAGAEAPKRVFEEKPAPVVDTGLQFMSGVNWGGPASPFRVHWLGNDKFIINALQDIPKANVVKAERTMLVDAHTGKSTQIVEPGWILWCYNPVRGIGSISPSPFKETLPYKMGQDDWQYRFVRVDRQGHITPASDVRDMEPVTCRPPSPDTFVEARAKGLYAQLRDEDGYLQLTPPGQRSSPGDHVVWMRPNKPKIELNILSTEVFIGAIRYLEFAKKYQLNSRDSQGNSSTDRRLGGIYWGNRPYDLTPYRLLALDGTLEEISYPKVIFDYGQKGFGRLIPTPVGLLINTEASLFLINGERLTRIWGNASGFFSKAEEAYGVNLSPDGCKAVFGRVADWHPFTRKPISILTLCEGA